MVWTLLVALAVYVVFVLWISRVASRLDSEREDD